MSAAAAPSPAPPSSSTAAAAPIEPRDVSWAQDRFSVHITVHIAAAAEVTMSLTDRRHLVIQGVASRTGEPFRVRLELAGEIHAPEHPPRVLPKGVRAIVHKKKSREWERLVVAKGQGILGLSYDWDLDESLERQAQEHGLNDVSSEDAGDSDTDEGMGEKRAATKADREAKGGRHHGGASSGQPAGGAGAPAVSAADPQVKNITVEDRRPPKPPADAAKKAAAAKSAVRVVKSTTSGGWSTATLLAAAIAAFGIGLIVGGSLSAGSVPAPSTTSGRAARDDL